MSSTQASDRAVAAPWYAAYPAPRNAQPESLTREQVLEMLKSSDPSGGGARKFLLVDLRRNDHEGGTIQGSINLPAQSLYPTIPTLYSIFKAAGIQTVIWYCSSSKGRGNRAAGWFGDYIADQGDTAMKSKVLREGIKGWAGAGDEYREWMVEYTPSTWEK
ncbi:related to arsenate reductase (Arc2) [Cephalotrichum gorgonifer]|uniref:Related to arsenate reductase (Arc2) n=1 Tax=Cephalotrichum gorgonifer TaxID=2041049 RepID=A0AAE8SWS9_9PEZI|nr:related to arsenate reductase (Arc2) [Cephalotrichum gorgonifer]